VDTVFFIMRLSRQKDSATVLKWDDSGETPTSRTRQTFCVTSDSRWRINCSEFRHPTATYSTPWRERW